MLAAKRLGAGRIIALSRHADRQALAKEFGATDIVHQRGEDAIRAVMALTAGVGVDATLERVGTTSSKAASTRVGSSTTRPTWKASPTPTPRWRSAAQSSL